MEKIITFLTILSWVAAVVSSFLFSICVYNTIIYPGSVDEIIDKLSGRKRTYPVSFWFIIATISWAFIIAF